MNNAMESWIERASRRAVQIGTVVLLVCLTLSSSMPTPTFNTATDMMSSPHQLVTETHMPPTQSTELTEAREAVSWDIKTASTANKSRSTSVQQHPVENSNFGEVLSTVQTSEEDNRISTRVRRMSSSHGSRNFGHGMQLGDTKQLYSRTGYWLAIYDNETINGTHDKFDAYTHLRITTTNFGQVKIKGVLSEMYVCMNRHGKLYPRPQPVSECVFKERFLPSFYAVFSSVEHSGKRKWYIGLSTNGQPRLGNRTRNRHVMAQFLLETVNWDETR